MLGFILGNKNKKSDPFPVRDPQEGAAADVVDRARLGDQVAIALITVTAERAKKGNSRAKKSIALIEKYAKTHKSPLVDFGAEVTKERNLWKMVVMLADLPEDEFILRNKTAFENLDEQDGEIYRIAFYHLSIIPARMIDLSNPKAFAGWCAGLARRVKLVRGGGDIALLCPIAAWELGE